MSATSTAPGPVVESRPGATFPRLLAMEWTKLRSVRSTVWSLTAFVVLTLGLSVLFTFLQMQSWNSLDPDQRLSYQRDATGNILGSGFLFGQLAICVLGVMVITAEYSTGMIRASLLAAPKRTPMLAAKVVVFAIVGFAIGEVVSFGAFFLCAPFIHRRLPLSISDPGVLRALFGAGLYLMMLGLFALAIGTLVRHTAAAITGVIAFVEVLAPLAQLLPGSFGKHVHAYLPTEAGHLVAQTVPGTKDLLTAWQGFGVFALWTVGLLIIAGVILKRRDA